MAQENVEKSALVGHRFRQEDKQFQHWCLSNGGRLRVHIDICGEDRLAGSSPCYTDEHYDIAEFVDREVPSSVADLACIPFETVKAAGMSQGPYR